MPRSSYMESKREGKSAGITFERTDRPESASPDLPVEHKATFAMIQGLGRIRLAEYKRLPNHETLEKPWHRQNILKANKFIIPTNINNQIIIISAIVADPNHSWKRAKSRASHLLKSATPSYDL